MITKKICIMYYIYIYVTFTLIETKFIICLIIYLQCMYYRHLKLSCPRLNNVLIVGCILCYLDVIVFTFETGKVSEQNMQILCQAKIWLISAGFTLVYGSLFAKTWRIHKIFTNKTSKAVVRIYLRYIYITYFK